MLSCNRPGSMYLRASHASGNVSIQAQSQTKVVCDDKVRLKVATVAEHNFTCEAHITFSNVPTSPTGLATGRIYNSGGTLKIKS